MLDSTRVAGHPESYFREPDEHAWAVRWGIGSRDGAFSYADYVQAALATGRTENGVFAARIMWGTLDQVVSKLAPVYPELAGADADLLERAFGRTRFVYLRRDDVVAQAVSWHRAEQTNVWFEMDQARPEREPEQERESQPEREPRFDFDQIQRLVQLIEKHNAAWREWFASAGIHPHLVRYEDLDADPVGVTRGILDFLGLELPAGREILVQHKRLADELNTRWIGRYREEASGSRSGNRG